MSPALAAGRIKSPRLRVAVRLGCQPAGNGPLGLAQSGGGILLKVQVRQSREGNQKLAVLRPRLGDFVKTDVAHPRNVTAFMRPSFALCAGMGPTMRNA
jgi:hypothetical protein